MSRKDFEEALRVESLLIDLYEGAFRDGEKGVKKRERVPFTQHKLSELGGSSGGAAPRTSLNPQVDNHLNNEQDERIIDIVKSMTMFGFHRGNWQKPIELHELIECTTAIKQLINQEKAKLVEVIQSEVSLYYLGHDGEGEHKLMAAVDNIFNRIKQEEGLK